MLRFMLLVVWLSSAGMLSAKNAIVSPLSEASFGDCVVKHTIYSREFEPGETAKNYFSKNPVGFIKDECAQASKIALGFRGKNFYLQKISGEVPNDNMSGSVFLCSPGAGEEYGCVKKNNNKEIAGTILKYGNGDYKVSITIGKIIESFKEEIDENEVCVENWRQVSIVIIERKSTWRFLGTMSGGACP